MIIPRRNLGTEFGLSPSKWRALSETKAPFLFSFNDLTTWRFAEFPRAQTLFGSVFSANGAESLAAWGNAPGTRPPTHCLALKARFIWAQIADSIFESPSLTQCHNEVGALNRAFSAYFIVWLESWGVAPG